MTDFVQTSETKHAVRKLSNPIEDAVTFNNVVQSVIAANPFGCVSYMTAGESHPAVEKTREAYTAKIIYQDNDARICGTGTHRFMSLAGYNNGSAAILADTALATAHGGIAAHDFDSDAWSATLKCHDPNGEIYNVVLSRDQVILTSYESEDIRTKVETWADSVPELA